MSVADVTFQLIVTDTPDGEVHRWTSFRSGAEEAGQGDAERADVTLTLDHATATELSRGELKPQAAFMQGRLKITGNMGKLLQHQDELAQLLRTG
jgi:putative sterol carrier protein